MKRTVWNLLFTVSVLLCGCADNSIDSSVPGGKDDVSVALDDVISNPKNQVGNGYVVIRDEASLPAWVSDFRFASEGDVIDYWGKEVFSVTEKDLLFSCGISAHRFENGLYGFLDLNGKTVIEPKYSAAHPFVNGSALVTENDDRFYIDLNGNRSEDKTHEGYHGDMTKHDWYGPFTGKYLVYQDADTEHAKVNYGYSDANGVDTDMPNIVKAYSFCNGFALVENVDKNQHPECYFIDENFNRVTDFSDEIESHIFRKRIVNTLTESELMLGLDYVYGDGYFVLNTGTASEPQFELIQIVPELYQPEE